MEVVVESLSTHYERRGEKQGKKVLILHGWGDCAKGWQPMLEKLAKKYDVVAVDLPGFGDTDMPPSVWALDNYAAFVAAFLKKISFKPFAIIGHNNGGAIAMRGLADGTFTTERLLLLDSAGIRSEYRGRQNIWQIITKTGKILSYPLPKNLKKHLRHKVYMKVGGNNLVSQRLQETFKRLVTDDVQSNAARLDLPTLLLYGEDDLSTPPAYGRILHNLIKGSRLEIIPGAGHFVHLDKPDEVLKLMEGHIDR
jgi:pimeloyl-ACP methyl ester carboxylesterase